MAKSVLMQNEYKFNPDFRRYVDRYCNTYGKTVDEALTHEIVRQAYLMYTET